MLTFLGGLPGVDPQYQNAADTSRRAMMADKEISKDIDETMDKTENIVEKRTGLSKSDVTFLAYGAPLVTQQITTKPFKNFKYNLGYDFVIHPEIQYNWQSSNPERLSVVFVLTREF